ncbi:aminoacyl-histidine dipeptidase [Sphaerochaeta halotolerans]|jgi:dipeptidase D|uniref:Cytosol non-specific dipeptidase n=1 Tax=Sphaerochaeta halotolerans TaxID=2293840 RepID=A0A372MJV0_9SPIR|nr:aminoacyl-histidine dipeptidase [Sphaerochaeta halotolerans]RFU96055.1 aminoacyl-histidine dipeptidase [Sphaerochaeta halotolerans]
MQDAVKGLKPQALWNYFSELSDIPRESGNEEGIRQYLLAFAKQHELEAIVDTIGNVIIRKKAYPGYEKRPSVALQGHMDMVCVKESWSKHDFSKDPIELVCDGDFLKANGTTLGGDNGIAIALALDILADKEAKHGPLEALFTVSEETGLTGAFHVEQDTIQSRLLINLDSEEEGVLYIGCAGGIEVAVTLPVQWEPVPSSSKAFTLTADGMLGGHSGGEIHKQRANAIKVAARALSQIPSLMVFKAEGGTKRNVIPSVCTLSFAVPSGEVETLKAFVSQTWQVLSDEYALNDPDVRLTLEETELPLKAVNSRISKQIITALYAAPHGVDAMSLRIPGIVETSSNLAILRLDEEAFRVTSSHRSSVLSARDDIARRFASVFTLAGAKTAMEGAYPAWTPNPDSALTGFCAKAYEEYTGKKPEITAIHAGLECGIINSKIPGMDSVSFGPNMFDVHSTKERLSISSVERISGFTRHLLSIIA